MSLLVTGVRWSFVFCVMGVLGVPMVARPRPQADSHTPTPTSVTIAGSLQSEAGCPSDWDAACASTHLGFDTADQVWQNSFSLPAGTYEYKAALNDGWAESYGVNAAAGGSNIALSLGAPATVKFYYSHATHWVTSNASARIATVAGSFQNEIGCAGDWSPDCLRSWLQDPDGDGTYTFTTSSIPEGSYEAKVAIDESWTENYGQDGAAGGANIAFTVPFSGAEMLFSFDSPTNALSVSARSGGHDGNVSWGDLRHDSRDSAYRTPAGPVATGTSVTLRLRALGGDLTGAHVRVWNDRTNSESFVAMTLVANDGLYDWWEATLKTGIDPTILGYRFVARDGTAAAYYEDDAARDGGAGAPLGATADRSWQLTVHTPEFTSPKWAKNAVVYQIFPDRFYNGNAANDTPAGTFFYDEAGGTIRRSGQTNWNEPICDPRAGIVCPGKYGSNFYGGDLQGIAQKMQYLLNLGVTVLYLNPVFESPSNHKYDTSDYGLIDDNLGGLTAFQSLISEAHAWGMKVVLDGAFNHTSSDSKYFDRYHRYASPDGACENTASTFRSWYTFHPAGSSGGVCAGDTLYESWLGYDSLPKLNSAIAETRQMIWGDSNSVARHWLAQGADGWRLDVPGDIDPGVTNDASNGYWEGFQSAVRAQKSDAWIVGEEWGLATPWLLGPEWHSAMNYQFSSAVLGFWRDEPFTDNDHNASSSAGVLAPLTPSQLDARLRNLEERYPRESLQAMMNVLGSHDTNRALFMLDHRTDENEPAIYQDPSYDWSDAMARLKGAALLQMTLPGAPTIYYGDEVGLVGPVAYSGGTWEDDPYNRQPYPWLDETGTPFYTHLQTESATESLRAHYQLLTATRNGHPALRTGSFDTLLIDDAADVYAYGRRLDDVSDAAVVMINRSDSPQTIAVNVAGYLPAGAAFLNVLTGASHYISSNGMLTVPNVPARSGALLVVESAMDMPPAAVTNLAAPSGGASFVNLHWPAVSGALEYDVYQSFLRGGGYTLVGTTSSTSFSVTGLTPAVLYYFVVVSRGDTRLTSGHSNEVSALPTHDLSDPGTSSFILQGPPTITHTISTTTRTANIYGRIWISGATEAPGAAPGIVAQVGYGPDGSAPGSSWTWIDMTFDTQQGDSDEYAASLLPDEVGEYDYAVRFSSNGGMTWYHADLSGPQRTGTLTNPGALTVVASADATAPAAPQGLAVVSTAADHIALSWFVNGETDLEGYEVFRQAVAGAEPYTQIASVAAGTTSYADYSVSSGASYRYYVKAYDTSFNRSGASNVVEAPAAPRFVDVTFHVTVPWFTPAASTVYITGSVDAFGPWNPGLVAATRIDATHWSYTLRVLDGTTFEYRFTRGTWDTVEKMADGTTDVSRIWTASYGATGIEAVNVTIENWRDPIVVSHAPAAGATNVSPSATVSVTWSKSMPANSDFSVSSPDGSVPGTFTYASGTRTTTFTPAQALTGGSTYSVSVAGKQSASGDMQQIPVSWTFTTACNLAAPSITPGGPLTFCDGGSVTLTSSSASSNQWYRDGGELTGQTGQTLVASVAGSYTVVVTSGSCTSPSSAAAVVALTPKPDATITVSSSSMDSGASSTAAVNVSCSGATFSWSISGGTITRGQGTQGVAFTAGAPGTLTLTVTVTNAFGCSDTKSADVAVQLAAWGAPPFLRATASGTSAAVQWAAVQSADHYEIQRSVDNSSWMPRGTSAGSTFTDTGLAAATTYLYRVRAVKADTTASAFSAADLATTIVFSDDPISVCGAVMIKSAHMLELRAAINVARATFGLAAASFTDPSLSPGHPVKAVHLAELRSALAPVLGAIGVTPAYTDPDIIGGVTTAKAAHVNELRDLMR